MRRSLPVVVWRAARGSRRMSGTPTNTSPEGEVLFTRQGSALVATLNRPKALNSLTLGMVRALARELPSWDREAPSSSCVVLCGAGGKAFCAGGDVKSLYDNRGAAAAGPADGDRGDGKGPAAQEAFFREEYTVDYRLAVQSSTVLPHVALWDGAVMGGGIGVSVNASVRLATEKTVFAMPETAIGFFPDVGGSYFLPRLRVGGKEASPPSSSSPSPFGLYLALTGARLTGADTVHAGAATHFLPSSKIPELVNALAALAPSAAPERRHAAVSEALARSGASSSSSSSSAPLPPFSYTDEELERISRVFSKATVEEILDAAVREGGSLPPPPAKGQPAPRLASSGALLAQTLRRMSPTALKLTLEQLKRGAGMTLAECYRMELRMALACMKVRGRRGGVGWGERGHERPHQTSDSHLFPPPHSLLHVQGNDFYEGVRALLVDKDNRPLWSPPSLEAVTPALVGAHFAAPPPQADDLVLS
jgi:enoyl-CoA hydratase